MALKRVRIFGVWKGEKEENLKYNRAPIVNSYQSNKVLINTDVIIKVSRTKVYIKAHRCGYKLLCPIVEKRQINILN